MRIDSFIWYVWISFSPHQFEVILFLLQCHRKIVWCNRITWLFLSIKSIFVLSFYGKTCQIYASLIRLMDAGRQNAREKKSETFQCKPSHNQSISNSIKTNAWSTKIIYLFYCFEWVFRQLHSFLHAQKRTATILIRQFFLHA